MFWVRLVTPIQIWVDSTSNWLVGEADLNMQSENTKQVLEEENKIVKEFFENASKEN